MTTVDLVLSKVPYVDEIRILTELMVGPARFDIFSFGDERCPCSFGAVRKRQAYVDVVIIYTVNDLVAFRAPQLFGLYLDPWHPQRVLWHKTGDVCTVMSALAALADEQNSSDLHYPAPPRCGVVGYPRIHPLVSPVDD